MNKKFLIILGVGLVITLSVIVWMGWKGYQLQKGEILITTGKVEYERGENLRLKIKNNLEETICFSSCYPYYLQRKNKRWESYKYVECYDFNGNGHCIDAEKEKFFELTLPEVSAGLHRLVLPVCIGCKDAKEFEEDKRFYSNEFWIGDIENKGTDKYHESILYCEKDEDCQIYWGPDHCGCGNKYYEFSKEEMRPSLVCGGDPNYQCKCIENKCQ